MIRATSRQGSLLQDCIWLSVSVHFRCCTSWNTIPTVRLIAIKITTCFLAIPGICNCRIPKGRKQKIRFHTYGLLPCTLKESKFTYPAWSDSSISQLLELYCTNYLPGPPYSRTVALQKYTSNQWSPVSSSSPYWMSLTFGIICSTCSK